MTLLTLTKQQYVRHIQQLFPELNVRDEFLEEEFDRLKALSETSQQSLHTSLIDLGINRYVNLECINSKDKAHSALNNIITLLLNDWITQRGFEVDIELIKLHVKRARHAVLNTLYKEVDGVKLISKPIQIGSTVCDEATSLRGLILKKYETSAQSSRWHLRNENSVLNKKMFKANNEGLYYLRSNNWKDKARLLSPKESFLKVNLTYAGLVSLVIERLVDDWCRNTKNDKHNATTAIKEFSSQSLKIAQDMMLESGSAQNGCS
ncbi:hypothetical protein VCHA53O466_50171 [Vibrio chagasii]|nr:hypothetical protein VCHA53O466_50171 [Vibrio chagasii]